jgi:hypothetical protein
VNIGPRELLWPLTLGMRKGTILAATLYLSFASVLWAQAFQNLDFEAAEVNNLQSNQSEFVSITNGLPGWSAYIGTNQLTQIGHNFITLGSPNVGIGGPAYGNGILQLEGTYAAMLQAGAFSDGVFRPASIAQTGLIPASAKSLRFEAAGGTGDLSVMVGGTSVPVVSLGSSLFGCDVSSSANSVEELRFTASNDHTSYLIFLDAITFSTEAIPEPSSLHLLLMGTLGLAFWCRTGRKTA